MPAYRVTFSRTITDTVEVTGAADVGDAIRSAANHPDIDWSVARVERRWSHEDNSVEWLPVPEEVWQP